MCDPFLWPDHLPHPNQKTILVFLDSLPKSVHTAQYSESSVTFVEAVGEGGEGVEGVLIS